MPKLTTTEIHEFLQERGHLARIATVKPDGSPSVVPVWFICEDGKILITPRKYSAFYANVQHEPRVAITVDEETGRYRKVLVEGTAQLLFTPGQDDHWRDIYRRIACRYVDDQSADYYLSETLDQPRALIGVELTTAKITTWRMPKEGEAYTGIWHKRYYEAGSKMAQMAAGKGEEAAKGDKLKVG
jgi:PPOX class probable F420-dependent enzyme